MADPDTSAPQEPPAEVSSQPWWMTPVGGGILIILLLWFFVVEFAGKEEWGPRLEQASTTLGLVGTIGTFGALVALVRQLEEQGKQLTLQRLALEDQRKASELQRHEAQAARFEKLREEYAEYLSAASLLFHEFRRLAHLCPQFASWKQTLPARAENLESLRAELSRASLVISLRDVSDERLKIRALLHKVLGATKDPLHLFLYARDATNALREITMNIDQVSMGKVQLDSDTAWRLGRLSQNDLGKLDSHDLMAVQSVGLLFAQLALRASLAADEKAAIGISPLTGTKVGGDRVTLFEEPFDREESAE